MPLIKRYIIMHETEGFVCGVYAERFERVGAGEANSFTGNRCGHFYIGNDIVATVDNAKCRVGVSAVMDSSRPIEDQGQCLSLAVNQQLRDENAAIQLM